MKKSSVLSVELTPSEIEELNRVSEQMRKNRLQRFGSIGDVDGYLQFLEDRQKLFGTPAKTPKRLYIKNSNIL